MFVTVQKVKAKINLQESGTPINLPDCYTRIAEIAFYKAEIRGFEPGHELNDWFEEECKLCSERVTKHKSLVLCCVVDMLN